MTAMLSTDTASALLASGAPSADFVVHDTEDHALRVSHLRAGRPALIVYEDRSAGEQNARFKDRLGRLARKSQIANRVALVPIADVKAWNFWPARGFVKDALRDVTKNFGVPVYADWTGEARSKLAAESERSNLVLLDRTGRVVWASSGKLDTEQEDRLLDLISRQALGGS